jgi:hypothetical protein
VITVEAPVTGWTSGGDPLTYEPVLEDATLEHQIVLLFRHDTGIAVSCNCLNGHGHVTRGHPRGLIETRQGEFPARDAITAYVRWHAEVKKITVTVP